MLADDHRARKRTIRLCSQTSRWAVVWCLPRVSAVSVLVQLYIHIYYVCSSCMVIEDEQECTSAERQCARRYRCQETYARCRLRRR